MSGSWSWSGTQEVMGSFGPSANVTISGGGPISGSGTMEGPPAEYRMLGSHISTNTVTIMGHTATSSDHGAIDESLEDVMVLCDIVVGRWALRIREDIEAAGFDEFVQGDFAAFTGVDTADRAKAIEDLLREVSRWASDAGDLEPGDHSLYIGRALSLLDRAQRLQASLNVDTPCSPDPRFATVIAVAMQDVLNTLLDLYPGIMNDTLVSVAIGSGAIGAGSPAPGTAAGLESRIKADLNQKFETLLEGLPGTEADLVRTARAGQMMGMETMGAGHLSPSDVLIVFAGATS